MSVLEPEVGGKLDASMDRATGVPCPLFLVLDVHTLVRRFHVVPSGRREGGREGGREGAGGSESQSNREGGRGSASIRRNSRARHCKIRRHQTDHRIASPFLGVTASPWVRSQKSSVDEKFASVLLGLSANGKCVSPPASTSDR